MSNGPFDIDVDTLGNLRPISKVVLSLGFGLCLLPITQLSAAQCGRGLRRP